MSTYQIITDFAYQKLIIGTLKKGDRDWILTCNAYTKYEPINDILRKLRLDYAKKFHLKFDEIETVCMIPVVKSPFLKNYAYNRVFIDAYGRIKYNPDPSPPPKLPSESSESSDSSDSSDIKRDKFGLGGKFFANNSESDSNESDSSEIDKSVLIKYGNRYVSNDGN
jgi:hypothetical protein